MYLNSQNYMRVHFLYFILIGLADIALYSNRPKHHLSLSGIVKEPLHVKICIHATFHGYWSNGVCWCKVFDTLSRRNSFIL